MANPYSRGFSGSCLLQVLVDISLRCFGLFVGVIWFMAVHFKVVGQVLGLAVPNLGLTYL